MIVYTWLFVVLGYLVLYSVAFSLSLTALLWFAVLSLSAVCGGSARACAGAWAGCTVSM